MSGLRLVGAGYAACPRCAGGMPGEVHDDLVCRCGVAKGDFSVAWDHVSALVVTRSGGRCEIRSPACLAAHARGNVFALPDHLRSLHHRRPRGMGGSRRVDTHTAANLLLTCGHGTTGCHGYAEARRAWARARGLLVPQGVDPASVPVVLASGRRVRLDPHGSSYLNPADGVLYAV